MLCALRTKCDGRIGGRSDPELNELWWATFGDAADMDLTADIRHLLEGAIRVNDEKNSSAPSRAQPSAVQYVRTADQQSDGEHETKYCDRARCNSRIG
jgi:hypothetical protein